MSDEDAAFFSVPIYNFLRPQLALNDRGLVTVGRIVALEPQHHSGIRYVYRVGEFEYTRSWGPWNPPVASRVDDEIEVTYLPDSPGVSVPGRPNVGGWWALPFIVMPGMAALGAFMSVWRWQKLRKTRTA